VKNPFHYNGPKMMFGSVSKHFANLRNVKKIHNLCSSLNAPFRGAKVVKHPFYTIGTKMMFGSVSEHFANLWYAKRCKTCVRAWMHYFSVIMLWSIHSTPLEPQWCLGVFRSILLTFDA
jgi:hypothetical protein